ncbi:MULTISPECIES: hypothetical protein [Halorussus]|uniref:hypothetical protein n=1 Tax=Halorussus TaxID=1070314 RepID=UPI000E21B1A8|nr:MULTISPECIES: hypothetical protein [Halorussus]NHN59098.1 hypothetical protein [Halorussus sp. JP-T4]
MSSLLDRLRNPDHTGQRRCWPCTAVNAAILLAVCAAVARRRSRSLAAALGVGGAATIALRGYLVPGTPTFAPRLASRLPGDRFHDESSARTPPVPARGDEPAERETAGAPDEPGSLGDAATEAAAGEAVLGSLVDAGVVVADGETVYLDDDFRTAWRGEMQRRREMDDEELATALESAAPEGRIVDVVAPGAADAGSTETDDRWFVVSDGSDDPAAENWLTRPVAVAEAAAVRTLADRTHLSETSRARAAGPLRTFLERCPVCDGPVAETTLVECCGGPGGTHPDAPDEVLACADCDARLYTFR